MPSFRYAFPLSASIGMFMVALDNTIVNVSLSPMAASLHSDIAHMKWVVTAYFLAQAAVIPTAGYLSERLGLKRLYLFCLGLFVITSGLCGLARTGNELILLRVLQGLGGGGVIPLAQASVFSAFAPEERARRASLFFLPILLAPSFGPTLGGYLTSIFGWKAIFLVNLPIGAIAFLLSLRFFPRSHTETRRVEGTFDWLGLVLSMAAAVALSYSISEMVENSPAAWPCLVLGLVLLVVFVAHVLARKDRPVLDLRLLRKRDFSICAALGLTHSAMFFGTMFTIPILFERLHDPALSPFQTGLVMMPQGLASALAVALNGKLYHHFGPRRILYVGTIMLATSSFFISRADAQTTGWDIAPFMILRGFAFSTCFWALQARTFADLGVSELPRASSLFLVSRQIFSSFGLTVIISLLAFETTRAGSLPHAGIIGFQHTFAWVALVNCLLLALVPFIPNPVTLPKLAPLRETEPKPTSMASRGRRPEPSSSSTLNA